MDEARRAIRGAERAMRVAVVAGGWHFPMQFYRELPKALPGADLFCIAHRDPELPIVREEKKGVLAKATGVLADLDRELYEHFPAAVADLRYHGWRYREDENTVGDWGFLNQWLARNDYRDYDAILSCHDDTYIRRDDLHKQLAGDWLILSNGTYPQAPEAYTRGSFEFFKKELLDMLGGKIDLGEVGLTRQGKTDSPEGIAALSEWNNTCVPLRRWMAARCLGRRIYYLSNYYRISPWVIEAERGFLHYTDGVPWSVKEAMEQTGLSTAVYA
jgi:hypothetical protein